MKTKSVVTVKASDEFERVRARVRKAGNTYKGLLEFRCHASPDLIFNNAKKFAVLASYKSQIVRDPFPTSFSVLPKKGFPYFTDFERELAWMCSILEPFAGKISEYISDKEDLESSILTNSQNDVQQKIERIEQKYGISLWLTEHKINNAYSQGGHTSSSKVVRAVSANGAPYLVDFIISWLSYRAGAAVSASEFEKLLNERAPPENGVNQLLHLLCGQSLAMNSGIAAELINYADCMPLIDRYEVMILTLIMLLASSSVTEDEKINICKYVEAIGRIIKDKRLSRIEICAGRGGKNTDIDRYLLDLYQMQFSKSADSIYSASGERAYTDQVEKIAVCIEATGLRPKFYERQQDEDQPGMMGRISDDLYSVLMFEDEGLESRLRLQKIALTYASCGWASSLKHYLLRQSRNEMALGASPEQMSLGLRAPRDHPILAFSICDQEAARAYLSSFEAVNDAYTFIDEIKRVFSLDGFVGSSHAAVIACAKAGNYLEAAQKCISASDTQSLLAKNDRLLAVSLYLKAGMVAESVDIAASLFVESRYFGAVLPMTELAAGLLKGHNQPLKISQTRGKISAAIVYDIYSRYVSSDREAERADAFKDVLRKNGVDQASDLIKLQTSAAPEQLIYFLRHVCVPDVLDQSLALESTRAVENERVAILVGLSDLMTENGMVPPPSLKEELREIRTRQVVRDTTLRLDQSKVYVNVDGIRRAVDVSMRENWNRYRSMMQMTEDHVFESLERLVRSGLGEKLTLIQLNTPATERRTLFSRMLVELRDQFTSNKEFGLNSNLSTNIRHGYVLRELRGPLIGRNLITNKHSESGSYQENRYWFDRLLEPFVDKRDILSGIFERFSVKIDEHIEWVNRRLLRIRSDQNPEGLFVYSISESAALAVEAKWSKFETHDEFIDAVFASFWDSTHRNLASVRNALVGQVLTQFLQAITDLETELRDSGIEVLIPALGSAAAMVKPEMRAAVERVASWFTLPSNNEHQDFDLEIAFQAGLQTVKTYFKNVEINAAYNSSKTLTMRGWTLPIFARLFFLILDNAATHGAVERSELNVNLSIDLFGEILHLTVINDLDENYDVEKLDRKVSGINLDYGQDRAMDLLGEEGGSGYPKIWKLIRTDLRQDHDLQVCHQHGEFSVDIIMNTRGFM